MNVIPIRESERSAEVLAYIITRSLFQQLLMAALFYIVGLFRLHHVYDRGLIRFWFWIVPLLLSVGHAVLPTSAHRSIAPSEGYLMSSAAFL